MTLVRRAWGARVNDMIDFTSGWLVANIGHDNRAVMRAVRRACGWAVIDGYYNWDRGNAIAGLRSILPLHLHDIALYNSGSEAIDAAVRLAEWPVVVHERAYHGSTGAVQSLKSRTLEALDDMPKATVLLETFLGPWCEWHPPELIAKIRARQEAGEVRVVFDEMQAGFGRTGRWFGFEYYDIIPDMIVGGKAAAGGFPFAFIAGRMDLMRGNTWESTFSGNALSCAACSATIFEIKRRQLIERVCYFEQLIREAFPQAQGRGFAYAFEHPRAEEIVAEAAKRGLLLLNTHRGTLKIAPPLCIRRRDLVRGLEILQELTGKDTE